DIKTMNDLFMHQLQDIYYAEQQLVKALPKMAAKASDKQLKQDFLFHLEETRAHVQRLEQGFETLGAAANAVDCPALACLSGGAARRSARRRRRSLARRWTASARRRTKSPARSPTRWCSMRR